MHQVAFRTTITRTHLASWFTDGKDPSPPERIYDAALSRYRLLELERARRSLQGRTRCWRRYPDGWHIDKCGSGGDLDPPSHKRDSSEEAPEGTGENVLHQP